MSTQNAIELMQADIDELDACTATVPQRATRGYASEVTFYVSADREWLADAPSDSPWNELSDEYAPKGERGRRFQVRLNARGDRAIRLLDKTFEWESTVVTGESDKYGYVGEGRSAAAVLKAYLGAFAETSRLYSRPEKKDDGRITGDHQILRHGGRGNVLTTITFTPRHKVVSESAREFVARWFAVCE